MKTTFFARRLLICAPFISVLMAGCGGGHGTKPNPSTSGPAIVDNALTSGDFRDNEDDRYYDIFVCDPDQSGTAVVEMQSDEVDSNILIYRKNSRGEFDLIDQNDDLATDNPDARVEFSVSRGKQYRIIATSASSEERGDYSLYFSEVLGRPARVLPDANRTAQSLSLPPMTKKSPLKK